MNLTPFLALLTLVTGIIGFVGLGYGSLPIFRFVFVIALAITIIYILEKPKKRNKYFD